MNSPYGQIAWWGFSPSLDLIDFMRKHEVELGDEINVLLIGSADARHILTTISNLRSDYNGKINFYVEESSLENIARQVLLINLALESATKLNTGNKSEMYLELFGNSLIRGDTEKYLVEQSNEFIRMITNPSYAENNFPVFDFSNLKFKEKDLLEGIFKFWRSSGGNGAFKMAELWNSRVRSHLGIRYDSRDNAFDWEYSMNLKEKSSIVNWHEYKRWRECGLAFNVRDESAYEVANRTLASGLVLKRNGENIPKRGYWGDIMNSPFIAYGVQSENKELFKMANNVHMKTSTDVSLYNITSYLYKITYGRDYKDEEEVLIQEVNEETGNEFTNHVKSKFKCVPLPMNSVKTLHKKTKYQQHFDMVFFSNSMVHCLDNSISGLFRDSSSVLVIESTKFMLDLKEDLHQEYGKKIEGLAHQARCELCKPFDSEQHNFAVFKYTRE